MGFCVNGIQHIGIPTKVFGSTLHFYEKLGFACKHTNLTPDGGRVAFLSLADHISLEIYEEAPIAEETGIINHISLNCTDIEEAYTTAIREGMEILSNGIVDLPFWENGIRYFLIKGPNGERIEFCQKL